MLHDAAESPVRMRFLRPSDSRTSLFPPSHVIPSPPCRSNPPAHSKSSRQLRTRATQQQERARRAASRIYAPCVTIRLRTGTARTNSKNAWDVARKSDSRCWRCGASFEMGVGLNVQGESGSARGWPVRWGNPAYRNRGFEWESGLVCTARVVSFLRRPVRVRAGKGEPGLAASAATAGSTRNAVMHKRQVGGIEFPRIESRNSRSSRTENRAALQMLRASREFRLLNPGTAGA
ncbi:hypothetical protein C8R43DRAFT_1020738 [Mycena crocata]|nr:hypothetical protein C8R43DRAFT_1020738 [Mycena crocata]